MGCIGGHQIYAFNYTRNHGLTTSSSYPYVDKMNECKYEASTMNEFQIDGYKAFNHVTRVDMEKLICEGVVAVGMKINICIKHYISGIIDDRNGECGCS